MTDRQLELLPNRVRDANPCPRKGCQAPAGQPCVSRSGIVLARCHSARVRNTTDHPVIVPPAAWAHPSWVGSCDWGGCAHPGWGLRWSPGREVYLTVCFGHANSLRTHQGTATDCQEAPIP